MTDDGDAVITSSFITLIVIYLYLFISVTTFRRVLEELEYSQGNAVFAGDDKKQQTPTVSWC